MAKSSELVIFRSSGISIWKILTPPILVVSIIGLFLILALNSLINFSIKKNFRNIKNLEKVLYFEQFIVVEPGLTDLKKGEVISEEQYIDYQDQHGEDSFSASIGAEAIEQMLQNIDLQSDYDQLKQDLLETKSELKKAKITKRLKLIEHFISSKNKPITQSIRPLNEISTRPLN